MKKMFFISALIALTATGSYALIDAVGEKKPNKKMQQFASRFDENKDGVITREESRSANDKMFDMIDENKDGKVTQEERKAFGEKRKSAFKARRDEILAKYDTNKDGKLSEEERKALRSDMRARKESGKNLEQEQPKTN
jgi:Ca2+-binding EF-hand superfamily protein